MMHHHQQSAKASTVQLGNEGVDALRQVIIHKSKLSHYISFPTDGTTFNSSSVLAAHHVINTSPATLSIQL